MAASSLLLLVSVLLCVHQTISTSCPPTSGIYLIYNGDCYPNGSFFKDVAITIPPLDAFPNSSYLQCVLPNSTLDGGEWSRTSTEGEATGPVDCSSTNINENLRCIENTSPANLTLYRPDDNRFEPPEDQLYKCCLPTNCSDPSTNIITAYIFRHTQLVDFNVELSSDLTIFPQKIKLHCITIGDDLYRISLHYNKNHQIINEDCKVTNCTRHLLHSFNTTYDNTVTLTWDTETISNDDMSFSQLANGDQMYTCNVTNRDDSATRTSTLAIFTPKFIPSSVMVVSKTATTITVNWTSNPTDADGYVVNATSDTAGTVTQQVEGGDVNITTLRGLKGGTTYNITIRAYQDLLGPASNAISVELTYPAIDWTLLSSITELENITYRIDCLIIDTNVSDMYWIVNEVTMNSSYTVIVDGIYNNSLVINPQLGESVNITCIDMNDEVDTVSFQAPSGPPLDIRGYILNETSIKVNWTMSSHANGYVIVFTDLMNKVVSSVTGTEFITNNLPLSTYNISVYSYIDVPSVESVPIPFTFNVPSPITYLTVTGVSTTTITVNWISPNGHEGNYVTHYNISYTPSCPDLPSLNVIIHVPPYTTMSSYTLMELYSGMNYTITVRAGNVLGESDPMNIINETLPTEVPSSSPNSVSITYINQTSINITWDDINCTNSNGRILEYIVMISNDTITYNITSTERYIIVNDLSIGIYKISVGGVNSIGSGPFSERIEVKIGIIPGTLSSIMGTTWAFLTWTHSLSYFNILLYEIGYRINIDSVHAADNILLRPLANISANAPTTYNVTNLINDTIYVFGIRAYTNNSHSQWTVITNKTQSHNDISLDTSIATLTSNTATFNTDKIIPTSSYIDTSVSIATTSSSDLASNGNADMKTSSQIKDSKSVIQTSTRKIPSIARSISTITTTTTTTTAETDQTSLVKSSIAIETVLPTESISKTPPTNGSTPVIPSVTSDDGTTSSIAGAIIGISLLLTIIILILIAVVVVIILRRNKVKHKITKLRRDNKLTILELLPSEFIAKDDTKDAESLLITNNDTAYNLDVPRNVENSSACAHKCIKSKASNATPPTRVKIIPVTLPIPLNNLSNHVAKCHHNFDEEFDIQYEKLYDGKDKPCTVGFSEENKLLNRFMNVTVYDENRIILKEIDDDNNLDFINACYINGYSSSNKFIASQGPMTETLVDFWRLVWQEKPFLIVMVTNLNEGQKNKCEQYWPNSQMEEEMFGPFIVTLLDEQILSDFVIRRLIVKLEGGIHTVIQYHFTSWPDHGVPDYVTPLMTLHKQVMRNWLPSSGPILVHCSAGVGRTGTFIAIDIALEQAKKEGIVDIAGIVNGLREQRMKMVQTPDQYVFIHDAVLEAIACVETVILSDIYQDRLLRLKQINVDTHHTGYESQFHLLSQITFNLCSESTLTEEEYLPYVKSLCEGHTTNSASIVNGYKEKKAFIVAQSPMDSTVRDFWKMIVDYKVSAIVMLCDLVENGKESCYPYWKNEDVAKFGEYHIDTIEERKENGYIERMFKITLENEPDCYNVVQFHITDWPVDGVVREPSTVLEVISGVIRRQQQIGGGPIVVHCSDTVSRTGVYCAVSIALEQCKIEGVVDVFQVTKALKRNKPGAVTTLEQYISIHEVIGKYLSMNSLYKNFSRN